MHNATNTEKISRYNENKLCNYYWTHPGMRYNLTFEAIIAYVYLSIDNTLLAQPSHGTLRILGTMLPQANLL